MTYTCPNCHALTLQRDMNGQLVCPGCGCAPKMADLVDLATVDVSGPETDSELKRRHVNRVTDMRIDT